MNTRGLKIHFIYYLKIKQNIKKLEKICGKEAVKFGPCLPRILFEIGINEKGCSRTYNKLMGYDMNILKQVNEKWEATLNEEIIYDTIEKSFKAITTYMEGAYHKYFQFKLLHSEKLYKMKIADSSTCKICQNDIETIKHTFLECQSVIKLWKQIKNGCKKSRHRH